MRMQAGSHVGAPTATTADGHLRWSRPLRRSDRGLIPVVADHVGKPVRVVRNSNAERLALGPCPAQAKDVRAPALKEKHDLKTIGRHYATVVDAP